MTEAFYELLRASLQGSIVILAVLLLRLLLKKIPRSVFCLLWLLAGLRLALPFEIESNLSLQPRLEETELSIQMDNPVRIPDFAVPEMDAEMPDAPSAPADPEISGDRESESFLYTVDEDEISPVTFGDIAARIWLLGMICMIAASAVSYIRLKRRVRMAYRVENGCFECPGLETAFVLGFLPPKIYLPAGLTEGEKRFICHHENAHIARHDHWYKLLGYLVLSLHWFNPLVWVGYGALCRDIELACDERVVKNMSLQERKAYSAALLSCGGRTARFAACPVAFGESNPRQRILNVLNYRRPTFWISLIAVITVIFVAVCLLTSPGSDVQPAEEASAWNLEMTVSGVSPAGAQVQFIQSGPFRGGDRARLQYGSEYTLEKWVDGSWEPVEMLPQEHEVAWTMEAYLIEVGSTRTQTLNWGWLYGQLPPGKYRIGKSVTLFYTVGESEHRIFYGEFEIEEAEPVWDLNMTEEEYLALCRDALADVQNRAQFHISETLAYFTGETEDSRSNVVFWRDGANCVRQSYVTRIRQSRTHLYYDGQLYYQVQEDSGDPTWSLVETDPGAEYCLPWLCLLQWDDQAVTFDGTAQEGDELRVSVAVHATPPTLGWDDVQEYQVLFFLDPAGNLTRAILAADHENIRALSDMKLESTLDSNIHSKVEQIAAQRPGAEQSRNLTAEQWIAKCREAMLGLKNSEELYLCIQNLEDPMATANVYMHTPNGWLFQYRRPGWDYEAVSWLRLGEEQFIYGGDTDENGVMTGPNYWQAEHNPESHDYQLPYPFDLDWENIELSYDGNVKENGVEAVTILFPLYLDKFTFYFSEQGELWYFDVGDSTGEPEATTSRFYAVFPYDGTVADYLTGLYDEATAQLGQKPGVPDDAFYEELFTRKTDGHYTEQWIHDLFHAFYAAPEEFVRRLAGHDRAEEIAVHMGHALDIYAPYRFASVLTRLREDPGTDPAILALLENIT